MKTRSFVQLDGLLLFIERGAATPSVLEQATQRAESLSRAGTPFSVLVAVDPRVGMLDADARAQVQDFMRRAGPGAKGFAVVLQGEGFWAATMRSVATALSMAARTEMKVFSSTQDALAWLRSCMPRGLPTDAAVEQAIAGS